ncbi:KTSC domain-containing protein [bacterium]|nr:KTSC domain-containing protein [bacterium]
MDRQFIESTMIASVGYDVNTATLEIEFKSNGAIWQYYDFPESLFYEFIGSDSIGKFFLAHIKGQYSENQVA